MRTAALTVAASLAIGNLNAEDLKIGATVYKDYSVSKVDPDGLRILHSDGAAKIPYEELPADLQKKYAFDPAKAAAFRADKAKAKPAAESPPPVPEAKPKPEMKPEAKPAAEAARPAAPPAAKEPDPKGWEDIPADPAKAQQGKTWGIAEVQAQMFRLDGKIIRVEIIANSASQIESIDATSCRMFAGTIFKENSNYEFIGFPTEAENKMRTLLRSAKGKMLFWVRVEAENLWPFPQLWVVGRSIHQGGLGTPPKFVW